MSSRAPFARESVVSRICHTDSPSYVDAERGPWWDTLPADFHAHTEPFDLSLRDRAKVSATSAADVVLRTLGASAVLGLAYPLGYHPAAIRRAIAASDFYQDFVTRGDKDGFFVRPPDVPITLRAASGLFRRRHEFSEGICEDLSFESPFVPLLPDERERYLAHRENRVARARMWRHRHGPRPTIIALHGFSADFYHLNEVFFALSWFYEMGCDVVCLTLPFHGARRTRFSPFSGHGFFAGGLPRLNEAFAQAICDLRVLIDWLEAQGMKDVGATGVSLGGFTSALLASVDPRLKFVIPNVPVVSMADLFLDWQPIGLVSKLTMRAFGQTIKDVRRGLAPSSPLSWAPVVPKERRMIVGGIGDRLAPATHARALWEHWDRCRLHWFPGSHLVHLDRGEYLKQIARFLGDLGFLPPRPSRAE